MPLPNSGPLSLGQVAAEFGKASNMAALYGVASEIPTSGQISLGQFYGKSGAIIPIHSVERLKLVGTFNDLYDDNYSVGSLTNIINRTTRVNFLETGDIYISSVELYISSPSDVSVAFNSYLNTVHIPKVIPPNTLTVTVISAPISHINIYGKPAGEIVIKKLLARP